MAYPLYRVGSQTSTDYQISNNGVARGNMNFSTGFQDRDTSTRIFGNYQLVSNNDYKIDALTAVRCVSHNRTLAGNQHSPCIHHQSSPSYTHQQRLPAYPYQQRF